ncbi:hypothetical protein [Paenibacillus sonchi]|nr:hypothetical protein [Paenibacillus sonchi]
MEQQMIQRYRREVYRIGWRLQYRSKKTFRNECAFFDISPVQRDEAEDMINRLSVEQLLDTLPAKGRVILQNDRSRGRGPTAYESTGGQQMETKNDTAAITDREFVELLHAAKQQQPEAILKIIGLFQEDIEAVSQRIRIPREDAVSHIVTELLKTHHE